MLLVHASDIHLDSPLVGLEAYDGCPKVALRTATRAALARLFDVAISERASLVLISGDLYDGAWKDYSTGLYFVAQARRLREADIPIVIVRGNHDAESQIAKHLKLPDNVRELSTHAPESVRYEGIDVVVHGQGFAVRDVREDLARRYPPAESGAFNVGMLHTALGGREGHEPYAPTSLAVLADKGYDYWALGHVHAREIVSRSPYVVYPGNLQGRHVREQGAKGATLIEVQGGRVAGVEHRDLDQVRWLDCVIDASELTGLADVVERVREELDDGVRAAEGRMLAARVTISGASRAHGDLIKGGERLAAEVRAAAVDVGGEGLWVGEIRAQTRSLLDTAALAKSRDPIALLMRAADEAATDELVARSLMACLADLAAKLPEEIRKDPAFAFLDDPGSLPEVLRDVQEMLVAHLVDRSDPEPP